ncbi:MAG: hypothetical protein A2542_02725 [Parcubacteria group bacterium RIFOXYD2_FULL_52_8]|nr:MAG: hypothetical protein A2542_02725 [Parcubacteria group bacterium RIFOXYD2_FULL_52_8]
MKKQYVDPVYAKSKEYKKVIVNIQGKDHCPFCRANFSYHKKKILHEVRGWIATHNSWPYSDTKHHFIILNLDKHIEDISDLDGEDIITVQALAAWLVKKYKIKGGALLARFGETRYTGATVTHLHFHLIQPELDPKTKRAKVVAFPVG